MMESYYDGDNEYNDDYYQIVLSEDSNLKFPLSSHSSLMNIAPWKDQRLELIDIPKGLIEVLQNTGFTVEKILDCGSTHIAEILGIDDYIGELIYNETKKATRNIISNSNF